MRQISQKHDNYHVMRSVKKKRLSIATKPL